MSRRMFRRLRTKLTVHYAGLFAAILLLIGCAVYAAVSDNAQRVVSKELATSGAVFDRVWGLRMEELRSGGELLSRDFGFRGAVATHDEPTIRSALENLKVRLGIDRAMLIGADGRIISADAQAPGIDGQGLRALTSDDTASGALIMGGAPYEVVSIPVTAPTTIGWVVFATRLDRAQMTSLESMAAIPLNASVLCRAPSGQWRDGSGGGGPLKDARIADFLNQGLSNPATAPLTVKGPGGAAMAMVRPLPTLDASRPVVLLLQYPVAKIMAPYRLLLALLIAAAGLGFLVLAGGAWALARTVTQPISALQDAARRLQRGEQATVEVQTHDEIGLLAESFNSMAAEIGHRESELQATKTFMDAVVENLPAMVVVKDLQNRFVLLNRAGEELLGLARQDFIGKTDHDLFPKEEADSFVERDRAVIASGRLELIPEEPIHTLANGMRYLQTKKIAIPDAEGRPQYLLAICEDITERKAAAEALETARDQAEAANRAKSSFLANMSHEVRTPLNGVIGVAGVLAQSPLDARQRQMVDIIENSASVLQRVLNDVLDLARVEAGRLQIVEEVFDLGAAIQALADSAKIQCQAKGLDFTLIMDETARVTVAADRVRLEQILGNLLSNAMKFTERGAVMLMVSRNEDGLCRLEVRDTGIGFDPVASTLLFQPFQQADGSITRRFGGTGLGLSISRELARAMGGDLTAIATPGEGAIFTLTLPMAVRGGATAQTSPAAREPAAEAAATAPRDDNEAPLRVLLADDHETNRTVVRLILETVGVDLMTVEDGAQAVAEFSRDRFDLILMDMQMPVMDGLTAIRRIREVEAQEGRVRTPILMLSANAMSEHVAAAHAAGADGHVAKPITPPSLIAAIEQALADGGSAQAERSVA
ncbi:MAG: response regulator [Caulobacterales bacterium]